MKLTRILPKKLALLWQEYDINKMRIRYQYHERMANILRILLEEAEEELQYLNRER